MLINKSKLNSFIGILLLILLLTACSKSGSNPTPKNSTTSVTITSLSVNSGPLNTSVIITGSGFSTTIANDQVAFNGKTATVTNATSTQLTATVPVGAGTGNVTVSVNNGATINGPVFTYQLSAIVSTLAGSGSQGSADGVGTAASFYGPYGIAVDGQGNIYVSDTYNNKIRKITPAGAVTTVAGNGASAPDNGTTTAANLGDPVGIAVDPQGNIFVIEGFNDVIRKITPTGVVSTLAGSQYVIGPGGIDGPPIDGLGTAASFHGPYGLSIDGSGNLFVAETGSNLIRKVTPGGMVTTYAGILNGRVAGSPVNGPSFSATFDYPTGVAIDGSGNLYVADHLNNMVREITAGGIVSTFSGSGLVGSANGIGTAATFNYLGSVALDKSGNIFVADILNGLIREITPAGVVTTFAGNGTIGHADGPVATAMFKAPNSLAIDNAGNIYIADAVDNCIRKISMQ